MRAHWSYLKYVIRHKWFVFRWCLRLDVPIWRALIHDWTKFLPGEWSAYVHSFYNPDGTKRDWKTLTVAEKRAFDQAWNHHQKANKHHWQYWVLVTDSDEPRLKALPMPDTYRREMVADWIGAGRAIVGKHAFTEWYQANKDKIILHEYTRVHVEDLLSDARWILSRESQV